MSFGRPFARQMKKPPRASNTMRPRIAPRVIPAAAPGDIPPALAAADCCKGESVAASEPDVVRSATPVARGMNELSLAIVAIYCSLTGGGADMDSSTGSEQLLPQHFQIPAR